MSEADQVIAGQEGSPLPNSPASVPMSLLDAPTPPGAAQDTVCTYPAVADKANVISDIFFGYTGSGTGAGFIIVKDGTDVKLKIPVTSNGAGHIPLSKPKRGSGNTQMTITLTNGGAGMTGYVGATQWLE